MQSVGIISEQQGWIYIYFLEDVSCCKKMWVFNSWFLTVLPCQKQSLHLPRMPTSNLVIKSVVVEGKKVASSVSTGSCRQTPADIL